MFLLLIETLIVIGILVVVWMFVIRPIYRMVTRPRRKGATTLDDVIGDTNPGEVLKVRVRFPPVQWWFKDKGSLIHRVRVAEDQLRRYDLKLDALMAVERTIVEEYIREHNVNVSTDTSEVYD